MKYLFMLPLLFSCAAFSAEKESVDVKKVNCENRSDVCVELNFKNKHNRPICIRNSYYPFDGALSENVFKVMNGEKKAEYKLIEPSYVTNQKNAILVRLIPSEGQINSVVNISNFYGLRDVTGYVLQYEAIAYYCDYFEDAKHAAIILNGRLNF